MTTISSMTSTDIARFVQFEEGLTIAQQCEVMGISDYAYYATIRRLEKLLGQAILQRTAAGRAHYRGVLTPVGRELRSLLRWYHAIQVEADNQLVASLKKLTQASQGK